MKSLAKIVAFVEVVNQNSFVKAASNIKVTPAAMSKMISALEDELGVQLLVRSTRQIHLTAEGLLFLDHAKAIIEACNAAESAMSQTKEEPSGRVKIVCGPHFGNQYIIPNVHRFMSQYPKVELKFEFTQSIPDLEKEKIDLIVGLSSGIPKKTVSRGVSSMREKYFAHHLII